MSGLRGRSALWLSIAILPILAVLVAALVAGSDQLDGMRPLFIGAAALAIVVLSLIHI